MGRLTAIVLGSAAGGGYPQWNCRCAVCRLSWDGDPRVSARSQTSLAVSADGKAWSLFNAAPDLRAQIAAVPWLHPRTEPRGSPIAAVVLTGAEVDQTAGLLTLRERQPFALIATAETQRILADNTIFDVLTSDLVTRRTVTPGVSFDLPGGLTAELFMVPGKIPLYLESGAPATAETGARALADSGGTVGVTITDGAATLAFVPGTAAMTPDLAVRLGAADAVLFDGTLFSDDEMIASGTGAKTGRRMGHMPIDGGDGSLAALAGLRGRRIYIHINNTNPILIEGSPERRRVEAAGWEVAKDGMVIAL